MDDPDDLGPLPESDNNSVLQAESFKALVSALPDDRFVLRPEPQPDAGVDWCIELRISGRFTGMRAHVQVKARAEARANSDGSVSYSADVSNINYLLNGSSPLYVVYLADRRELRYAWVRDEVNRIQKENPGWMGQKSLTLRFTAMLDEAGIQDVQDRIRQEARLDRQIHDVLSRADVTEKTIHVNLKQSKVTDPDELSDLLLQGGMTLVSSGEAAGVLEAIDRLSSTARRLPRLLLVRTYAECSLGRYQMATGHLTEVSLRAGELSESDRQFLDLLRGVCDYHLGRITASDYMERQKELAERAEGEFGLSRRIDYLWSALLADGGRRGLETYLPQLREAVSQALAMEDASESFRIQARTARLCGEGVRFVQRFNHDLMIMEARRAMGVEVDVRAVLDELNADRDQWTDEANDLVRDAVGEANARLVGDACYVRSYIMFAHYSIALQRISPEAASKHVEMLKSQVIPDIRRAIECYEVTEHIEWSLRAKLLLANLSDLTGDRETALQMAGEVLPVAEAYQFDKMAKEARDHLAGDPFFRQLQRKFLTGRDDDPDVREARFTDEDMVRYAEDVLEASGLPRDRLPAVTLEVLSFRDVARERVGWCRYIQLIQDLTHTRNPATYYAYDPERRCYCEKYGFASKVGSTDWRVLIEAFKDNYCSGCPARSPKGVSSPRS